MTGPEEVTCACGCGRTFPAREVRPGEWRQYWSPACSERVRKRRRLEERTARERALVEAVSGLLEDDEAGIIELPPAHAEQLREAIVPYVLAGEYFPLREVSA